MKPVALLRPDSALRRSRQRLRTEGALFARYLVGPAASIENDLLERYADGCETLFDGSERPADVAVVEFVRRHPWALACVDAAAALFCPQTLIRKKLLLLLAVLETAPAHVGSFTSVPRSRAGIVLRLVWWAGRNAGQALIGAVVLWLARRGR
jgi:hypothetical protein